MEFVQIRKSYPRRDSAILQKILLDKSSPLQTILSFAIIYNSRIYFFIFIADSEKVLTVCFSRLLFAIIDNRVRVR